MMQITGLLLGSGGATAAASSSSKALTGDALVAKGKELQYRHETAVRRHIFGVRRALQIVADLAEMNRMLVKNRMLWLGMSVAEGILVPRAPPAGTIPAGPSSGLRDATRTGSESSVDAVAGPSQASSALRDSKARRGAGSAAVAVLSFFGGYLSLGDDGFADFKKTYICGREGTMAPEFEYLLRQLDLSDWRRRMGSANCMRMITKPPRGSAGALQDQSSPPVTPVVGGDSATPGSAAAAATSSKPPAQPSGSRAPKQSRQAARALRRESEKAAARSSQGYGGLSGASSSIGADSSGGSSAAAAAAREGPPHPCIGSAVWALGAIAQQLMALDNYWSVTDFVEDKSRAGKGRGGAGASAASRKKSLTCEPGIVLKTLAGNKRCTNFEEMEKSLRAPLDSSSSSASASASSKPSSAESGAADSAANSEALNTAAGSAAKSEASSISASSKPSNSTGSADPSRVFGIAPAFVKADEIIPFAFREELRSLLWDALVVRSVETFEDLGARVRALQDMLVASYISTSATSYFCSSHRITYFVSPLGASADFAASTTSFFPLAVPATAFFAPAAATPPVDPGFSAAAAEVAAAPETAGGGVGKTSVRALKPLLWQRCFVAAERSHALS